MNFDFPTILVLACLITGGIWLVDVAIFAPRRRLKAEIGPTEYAVGNEESQIAGAKEPLLVEYSKSFFPVILIVLLLRSFLVEPFRIPSGSMMPTLLVGDFILVNKFTYGIRLPVLNKKIIEMNEPKRGDVIVFRYPQDPSVDYIKRVVGVPGDSVGYREKIVYINGKPMRQIPVGRYTGVGAGTRETGSWKTVEDLDGVEHNVLTNPRAPNLAPGCNVLWRGDIVVPEGHYFVMGDNRDNSNDSRCWGLVPGTNLVGKAFGIWMSWDTLRSGFPIDWSRLGEGID